MSTIKVDNLLNSTGDQDSGIDLSTNDQILMKTANTTAVTVDSSQNVTLAGNLALTGNLTVSGTSNVGDATTLTEVATPSGTYQDITVPNTAKIIHVGIMGFSQSGSTANFEMQLGTSSGIVTSGYSSTALYLGGGHNSGGANVTKTDSFVFAHSVATSVVANGLATIVSMGSNKYCFNSSMSIGSYINWGAGYVSLGGAVTTIRVQTDSGQTLDAGSFNVTYIE